MRNCPYCKKNDASTYMKSSAWNNRDGIELKKCKQCSFVFSAVFLYDYGSMENQDCNKSKKDLITEAHAQGLPILVEEIIAKSALQQGKALDFGCGIGLAALCLQQNGFNTYGIESSQAFLAKHKELNISSADNLEALNVEKNSFDIIIMKDVLEHVDNPVELLPIVLSYLKPSGHFYIRVPNVYHYNFHWSIDTKSHVNHFTPKQLMKLLNNNRMKKVDFIGVYDISTRVGKLYNSIFWKTRYFLPMYHQISLLYQKQ